MLFISRSVQEQPLVREPQTVQARRQLVRTSVPRRDRWAHFALRKTKPVCGQSTKPRVSGVGNMQVKGMTTLSTTVVVNAHRAICKQPLQIRRSAQERQPPIAQATPFVVGICVRVKQLLVMVRAAQEHPINQHAFEIVRPYVERIDARERFLAADSAPQKTDKAPKVCSHNVLRPTLRAKQA